MAGEYRRNKNFFKVFMMDLESNMLKKYTGEFSCYSDWLFSCMKFGIRGSALRYTIGLGKEINIQIEERDNKVIIGVPLSDFKLREVRRYMDMEKHNYFTKEEGIRITNAMMEEEAERVLEKGIQLRMKASFKSLVGDSELVPIIVWSYDKDVVSHINRKGMSYSVDIIRRDMGALGKGLYNFNSYDMDMDVAFTLRREVEFLDGNGDWKRLSGK